MKTALVGFGSMGKLVYEELGSECAVVIAPNGPDCMNNLLEYSGKIDVIIDFSVPDNLNMIYEYASLNKIPVIFATTGYSEEQTAKINELSKLVPVLVSSNFSIGSILMNKFIREVTPLLSDSFDIEIVETSKAKKDLRTASTTDCILKIIKKETNLEPMYGRDNKASRAFKEIGVHSIKGGELGSSHEVMYCGDSEILSIKHTELSQSQFAEGAVDAAKWIIGKEPKLYSMEDVILSKLNK